MSGDTTTGIEIRELADATVASMTAVAGSLGLGSCEFVGFESQIPEADGAYVSLAGDNFTYWVGVATSSDTSQSLTRIVLGSAATAPPPTQAEISDFFGEMANIITGHMKPTLSSREPHLMSGMPMFVRGELRTGATQRLSARVRLNSQPAWLVVEKQPLSTDMRERRRMELELANREMRLRAAHAELQTAALRLNAIFRAIPDALFLVNHQGNIEAANDAAQELLATPETKLLGEPVAKFLAARPHPGPSLVELASKPGGLREEVMLHKSGGGHVPVFLSATPMASVPGQPPTTVCVAADLRERKRLEAELRNSQKLESVGRLAGGVAHEINTPVQFANDNIYFVRDVMPDLVRILTSYRELRARVERHEETAELMARIQAAEEAIDLDFVIQNVPEGLDRATEGLHRVAEIVRSMKAFAHPGNTEKAPVDLNEAIGHTLTVARHEYKDVAHIETHFGELPHVVCNLSEINQVLLNIIINAAHAIREVVQDSGTLGTISLTTTQVGEEVIICIRDTGGGIPEAIRHRIFDPFFTTKPVGVGSGQGLAIARAVVCDKHHGQISFETALGHGTTFTLRLPIAGGPHTARPPHG